MAGADGDSAIQAALEVLELARAGRFADVRDRFAPNLQPLVVREALAQAWDAELDKRGAITMIGSQVIAPAPPPASSCTGAGSRPLGRIGLARP
jgi:hypothetical protein